MAGISDGKDGSPMHFLGVFRLEVSPLIAGIVANLGYKVEEEEEGKILGPIWWPEVAGRRRNRPVKSTGTVARGERIG